MNTIKTIRSRFAAWLAGPEANQNRISMFEVKALYDAAYEEKTRARTCLKTFRALLKKAEMLDAAYRDQIAADQLRLYGKAA